MLLLLLSLLLLGCSNGQDIDSGGISIKVLIIFCFWRRILFQYPSGICYT